MINIGFAITGSFCTHEQILHTLASLDKSKYNIIPLVTPPVEHTSTRFGNNKIFLEKLENICQNKIVSTIVDAEPLGPKGVVDALIIAPCTGNTLAKLANAITDNAVTMLAKSLSRNNKPVIIGISTNDALGLNFKNIATLINTKNYYFIPFKQDDHINKPKSLVCDFKHLEETLLNALNGIQYQPIIAK